MAKMFMCYDCQPYSAMLVGKLVKYLSQIARNKFMVDNESESVVVRDTDGRVQIATLNLLANFMKSMNAKPMTEESQEKIKFLLDNKSKIFKTEKALKDGGRKAIKKVVAKFVGEDDDAIAFKVSEFLLYSRTITVEMVLELIGHKQESKLLSAFLKKFDPVMYNKNMEKSIRELFTSFRLAGVESQTVERVLENFGYYYFDLHLNFWENDGIIKFSNKQECYDFAYLLIMLHTCHHNPNLENKTNFKWFLDSVKDLCKETFPTMEEKDLLDIFNGIGETEFESPQTRNLLVKPFSFETLPIELFIRTRVRSEDSSNLSDIDYINCLLFETEKKLFHHHNTFEVPESLIDLSKTHISELIFKDIKNILTENIDSENFVIIFDKVFEICSNFGREDILEDIMKNMFERVKWTKYYQELTDTELNLCSWLIIYLCKWVARFKSLSPHVSTILTFAYENVWTYVWHYRTYLKTQMM